MKRLARIAVLLLLTSVFGTAAAQSFKDLFSEIPGKGQGSKGLDVKSAGENLAKAFKEPSEKEERQIGRDFSAILVGAKPLVNNARMQAYVNSLGRWLATHTERPDLEWTFGVLDDMGYNAFAAPGGYIFVTKGLLLRMRSEAELAGVLAHEIAHVVKKHHLNAMKNQGFLGFVGDLAKAKTGKGVLSDELVKFGKNLFANGLSKSDESEADQLGVVIAARAGYDAFGLPAALQTLQSQSAADDKFSLLLDTHPSTTDRINDLDSKMGNKFDALNSSTGRPFHEVMTSFGR